ncbi:MAG: MBL fold metallo-hydrolase [Alphaproteobacteria bacterium]
MRVTILGCGPSTGVPLLGCDCAVCRSTDPRNRRRRSSIVVEEGATRILVDASPDLREQLLDAGVSRVDAVLFTHGHADHVHGIDDLRLINHNNDAPLDAWSDAPTLAEIERRFGYAFEPNAPGRGWYKPRLVPREITGPFTVGDIDVTPFEQGHGDGVTLGLRFGPMAYSTDVNALSEDAFRSLAGVELWIVDCLRRAPNPMHAHLPLTLDWIRRVAPRHALLTHMNHDLEYHELREELPPGTEPAYDGMVIDLGP